MILFLFNASDWDFNTPVLWLKRMSNLNVHLFFSYLCIHSNMLPTYAWFGMRKWIEEGISD